MDCAISGIAAVSIMAVAVLGGIIGGYAASQIGPAIMEKHWASRLQQEGRNHPLATIVALISFCMGFFAVFLFISGVLKGAAC